MSQTIRPSQTTSASTQTNAAEVMQKATAKVKETKVQVVIPEEQATPKPVELIVESLQVQQMFQQYRYSKPSCRMITTKGKKFSFVEFELLTQDEDIITYLDNEIKLNPRLGITKGALMSVDDKDPMAALKRQHVAEYLTEQKQKAIDKVAGITRNMGVTENAINVGATHSGQVAN